MFLHERIQLKLDEKHLRQADIARATGKSTAAVAKWLKGDNVPKTESLKQIAQLLGTTDEWLLTGKEEPSEKSNAKLSDKKIDVWTDGDQVPEGMIPIPYYSGIKASMGNGYNNEDNQEEEKLWFRVKTLDDCNVNPNHATAITVVGDSMYPEISNGQVIAIDTSATRIFDGEIYAFLKDGELKVKYLFKLKDGFKAVSRNDDKIRYPDEIYTAEDIESENIRILGQYWWKSETRRIRR